MEDIMKCWHFYPW